MKKIIALAVAAVVAAPAMADLTLSANIETNSTVQSNADFAQAGRVAVTVAGGTTAESGMYVKAQTGQEFGLDASRGRVDTFLEIGNEVANVKLGAVREAEIWSQAGDTYVAQTGAVAGYKGTSQRDRQANNVIVTVNAGAAVVQAMLRDDNGNVDTRYTVTADLGGVKVGAAMEEAGIETDATTGYVLNVSAPVGAGSIGASYAKNDADSKSWTIVGSFAGVNAGYLYEETAAGVEETALYAAYPVANFAGVEGLTMTPAVSMADDNTAGGDDVTGARIRFNYSF